MFTKMKIFFCLIQTDVNFGFEGVDFQFPPLLVYNKYMIIVFLKLVCIYFGIYVTYKQCLYLISVRRPSVYSFIRDPENKYVFVLS